jgi:hypothetical protein
MPEWRDDLPLLSLRARPGGRGNPSGYQMDHHVAALLVMTILAVFSVASCKRLWPVRPSANQPTQCPLRARAAGRGNPSEISPFDSAQRPSRSNGRSTTSPICALRAASKSDRLRFSQ